MSSNPLYNEPLVINSLFFLKNHLKLAGRRSPVADRRSPVAGRRSPVAGRRSPPTTLGWRYYINALGYHDICCIAIGRTCSALCAAGQNRRLLHYKRTARFQLRVALLEVVRTEWSTSASSWEQGRSTPAVAVDSEELKDGRHQCFEVSAWICFSDVYVGSLYGDSPVAGRRSPVADRRSPVRPPRRCTNLLCWTLESDTPNDGNRFARVRLFAGVLICCVGRWNLIR